MSDGMKIRITSVGGDGNPFEELGLLPVDLTGITAIGPDGQAIAVEYVQPAAADPLDGTDPALVDRAGGEGAYLELVEKLHAWNAQKDGVHIVSKDDVQRAKETIAAMFHLSSAEFALDTDPWTKSAFESPNKITVNRMKEDQVKIEFDIRTGEVRYLSQRGGIQGPVSLDEFVRQAASIDGVKNIVASAGPKTADDMIASVRALGFPIGAAIAQNFLDHGTTPETFKQFVEEAEQSARTSLWRGEEWVIGGVLEFFAEDLKTNHPELLASVERREAWLSVAFHSDVPASPASTLKQGTLYVEYTEPGDAGDAKKLLTFDFRSGTLSHIEDLGGGHGRTRG